MARHYPAPFTRGIIRSTETQCQLRRWTSRWCRTQPLLDVSSIAFQSGAPLIYAILWFRSEWTLDLTHPRVDVHEGWQYARVLDDSEDKWSAEQPPQLERLLGGSGIVQGMTSSGSSGTPSGRMSPNAAVLSPRGKGKGPANTRLSFARRRRWVSIDKLQTRMCFSPSADQIIVVFCVGSRDAASARYYSVAVSPT